MVHRDRDEAGRPRSARPRDALGRPLDQGSAGVPRIPDDLQLSPAETPWYDQALHERALGQNAEQLLAAASQSGLSGAALASARTLHAPDSLPDPRRPAGTPTAAS